MLVLLFILFPDWTTAQLKAVKGDQALGVVFASALASGGIGFVLSVLYHVNHLIDHEIDLKVFEHRYRNDETGAPAYDPAILLKVIPHPVSLNPRAQQSRIISGTSHN